MFQNTANRMRQQFFIIISWDNVDMSQYEFYEKVKLQNKSFSRL